MSFLLKFLIKSVYVSYLKEYVTLNRMISH